MQGEVKTMNEVNNKYMELFGTVGMFVGFIFILYYAIAANEKYQLVLIGILVIFVSRLFGWVLDRITDAKKVANKKGKR